MEIEYVGSKASKTDNVAKTGTVWNYPGDVKTVPDHLAGQLLAHPDIWRRYDPKNPYKPKPKIDAAYEGQPVLVPCAWMIEVKAADGSLAHHAFPDPATALKSAEVAGVAGRLFGVAEIPGTAQPVLFVERKTKLELNELDPADVDDIEAGRVPPPALPATPKFSIQVAPDRDPLVLDGVGDKDIRDVATRLGLTLPKSAKGDALRQAFVDAYPAMLSKQQTAATSAA